MQDQESMEIRTYMCVYFTMNKDACGGGGGWVGEGDYMFVKCEKQHIQ